MTEYEFVLFAKENHVAWITLNRPEVLNAMHPPMAAELCEVWKRVREAEELWMAVLTGSGERAFSAGADLKWRAEAGESDPPSVEHVQAIAREEVAEGFGLGTAATLWAPQYPVILEYCGL